MLRISDFVAITAGFFGVLIFYLVFSGNLTLDYGTNNGLPVIEREMLVEMEQRGEAEYVVLYGNEAASETSCQIIEMLNKLKKGYIAKGTVEELSERQRKAARVFIVTTGNPAQVDEQQELLKLAEKEGKYIFFTSLSGENPVYESELGVLESRGEVEIDGMFIFEGLMVQGMVYYEKLPMTVRNITLDASCTKMILERSEEKKEQRSLIPLLWKKQYGNGIIYSCSGPFFSEKSGIGIFAGILSDTEEVFLYPVVNSSAILLDYYPDFEHVNKETIRKLYSRDPVMFIRDIIWPSMAKIRHSENVIISGKSHMQDKGDDFYDMQLQMRRGNGIIIEAEEGNILPVVSKGHVQSDEKRYQMESAASGEGLTTVYLDMRQVLGKEEEEAEYEWASYSLELTKNIYDVYRNNRFIETVNWLEAEERFKRYERIIPEYAFADDSILVRAEGFVDVWYCMVRTDRKLEEGVGYEMQQIGEDAYLLEIRQQEVTIPLDSSVRR